MAVTPPISRPSLVRRTHGPLHLCLTPSLSPYLLKRPGEVTWQKRWRAWSSRTWVVCQMCQMPFSTNQGDLLWTRSTLKIFPQASSINVYCYPVVVQVLGRGEMAQYRSRRSWNIEPCFNVNGKLYLLCQIIWGEHRIFLFLRPGGQEASVSCIRKSLILILSSIRNWQAILPSSACSWTMQLTLSCLFFVPPWYGLLHLIYKNTVRPYNYLDRGLQL